MQIKIQIIGINLVAKSQKRAITSFLLRDDPDKVCLSSYKCDIVSDYNKCHEGNKNGGDLVRNINLLLFTSSPLSPTSIPITTSKDFLKRCAQRNITMVSTGCGYG